MKIIFSHLNPESRVRLQTTTNGESNEDIVEIVYICVTKAPWGRNCIRVTKNADDFLKDKNIYSLKKIHFFNLREMWCVVISVGSRIENFSVQEDEKSDRQSVRLDEILRMTHEGL